MKAGDICKRNGIWCCGYHKKNKIKIMAGSTFPTCNFAGLNCEGFWCWQKEWHEITLEEKMEAHKRRLQSGDRARNRRGNRWEDEGKKSKPWKFDWEKW